MGTSCSPIRQILALLLGDNVFKSSQTFLHYSAPSLFHNLDLIKPNVRLESIGLHRPGLYLADERWFFLSVELVNDRNFSDRIGRQIRGDFFQRPHWQKRNEFSTNGTELEKERRWHCPSIWADKTKMKFSNRQIKD